MRWAILAAALVLAGCDGYRAERAFASAKENRATHTKLCRLAREAADTYDGSDPDKASEWRGKARYECALAELSQKVGVE